jgi:pyruvate carboxylase
MGGSRSSRISAAVPGASSGLARVAFACGAKSNCASGSRKLQSDRPSLRYEFIIEGVITTIPFHQRLLRHPGFISGDTYTRFLQEEAVALGI